MQEKKKFILAVPTIIIIIIFIISMIWIFYSKNYKKLNASEALSLAEKTLTINNLSCQVVVTQGENEMTTNYKRKDNIVYISSDDYIEIINIDTNECVYIDEENKEVYKYVSENVIESYNSIIYAGVQALNDENYTYSFIKYEKCNGIKCAYVNVYDETTSIDMWLDRDSGMIVKYEITYKMEDEEDSITASYLYRYQIGSVTDEEVEAPSTDDYTIVDYSE